MEKLKFIGYHATSQDNVHSILNERFIINRVRTNEWLGHGIYMFTYKIDADTWANNTYYCKNNPAVIKCFVEVEEEKYLDLDNPTEKNIYESYFDGILKELLNSDKSVIFRNEYEAMCWGLNIYKKDKNFDLIKYTFANNRTRNAMKYGNINYGYSYNEIQMCASKNQVIIKKEIC